MAPGRILVYLQIDYNDKPVRRDTSITRAVGLFRDIGSQAIKDGIVKFIRCTGHLIENELSSQFPPCHSRFQRLPAQQRDFDHVATAGFAAEAAGPQVGNHDELM